MMRRTLDDIRSNLDHVGCDNATALELCDEIDNLCAQLREAGKRAGLLQQQLETPNRNHDDLRANCARATERCGPLSAALANVAEALDCNDEIAAYAYIKTALGNS